MDIKNFACYYRDPWAGYTKKIVKASTKQKAKEIIISITKTPNSMYLKRSEIQVAPLLNPIENECVISAKLKRVPG